MQHSKFTLWLLVLSVTSISVLHSQATIPASGGSASGTGGSVTYTLGQIACSVFTGTNGSIIQGVQQPYEISTVTAIENTSDIFLEYTVYPNPTEGSVRLIIGSPDDDKYGFQIYDQNGRLIQKRTAISRETEILLDNLPSSVYFLKVLRNSHEVKVFKIVKR
jgi:hypothetical protein